MIPFNLEEYTKNPNRKIVTRDGRAVTKILCTDAKGDHPIVALIEGHDGTFEISCSYTNNGKVYSSNIESCADLFFAPEKHKGWVNVYRDFGLGIRHCKCVFDSEEEALRNRDTKAVATVKIEWEE